MRGISVTMRTSTDRANVRAEGRKGFTLPHRPLIMGPNQPTKCTAMCVHGLEYSACCFLSPTHRAWRLWIQVSNRALDTLVEWKSTSGEEHHGYKAACDLGKIQIITHKIKCQQLLCKGNHGCEHPTLAGPDPRHKISRRKRREGSQRVWLSPIWGLSSCSTGWQERGGRIHTWGRGQPQQVSGSFTSHQSCQHQAALVLHHINHAYGLL